MKQTENQRMKLNSGPQKLGPAETGSLKEHKEAQLNKFNSRISNQPVFPPNYLEFDSSDSSNQLKLKRVYGRSNGKPVIVVSGPVIVYCGL